MSWKLVSSGGKSYTIEQSSSGCTVRKNNGFVRSTGARLGTTKSLVDAFQIIKSDSGSQQLNVRDG
jgi:hypothetical protein